MVKHYLKIVWDKKALDQFIDILSFLEIQSNQAANIVKNAIIDRLDLVKTNPLINEIDKLKDPPKKEFRAFVVFSYRVTYQIKMDKKEIRVLRIRHTSREPLGY